jgi:sulfopyruvate decarboxylase subunit alpha/phosphonopyruvate decarboxylase
MTANQVHEPAEVLADALIAAGFGPSYGTPCGILAPLYALLEQRAAMLTIPREDSAVGVAAGAAMAGRLPVVLMQNSGLGQAVNALASLVVPYGIPMLLIISLRGVDPDPTPENIVMGRISASLLAGMDIPAQVLDAAGLEAQVGWALAMARDGQRPVALLVPPTLFGWKA